MKQFQYHKGAKYIDCKGKGADYCDRCGYTDESHNKKPRRLPTLAIVRQTQKEKKQHNPKRKEIEPGIFIG